MIINTGQRTDIPAFYAEWFANRLREGFVCVRNPYRPEQVSRYRLDPAVVDVIGFCTCSTRSNTVFIISSSITDLTFPFSGHHISLRTAEGCDGFNE